MQEGSCIIAQNFNLNSRPIYQCVHINFSLKSSSTNNQLAKVEIKYHSFQMQYFFLVFFALQIMPIKLIFQINPESIAFPLVTALLFILAKPVGNLENNFLSIKHLTKTKTIILLQHSTAFKITTTATSLLVVCCTSVVK